MIVIIEMGEGKRDHGVAESFIRHSRSTYPKRPGWTRRLNERLLDWTTRQIYQVVMILRKSKGIL